MKENDVSLEDSLSRGRSLNVVSELAKYTRTINIRICFSRRQSVLRADVSSRVDVSSRLSSFRENLHLMIFSRRKKKKKRKKNKKRKRRTRKLYSVALAIIP